MSGLSPVPVPPFSVDDVPTLIWATDARGALTYANRRAEAVLGRGMVGLRDLAWQEFLVAEDRAALRTAFRRALRHRLPFVAEARLRTAEAGERIFRIEATPRRDEAGGLLGYVGCATDVTEARRAERALRDGAETLERRVEERTAQLATEAAGRAAAQDRLRHTQKLEALGQLAGGVAHDFSNASAAIIAALTLLGRRHAGALAALPPEARRLLAGVREAAERGGSISRRLLGFARREELRAADIEPGQLLRGLREVIVNALGPAVRVLLDLPPDLPPLRADRAQVETVLINLAVNARDAMPGGGTVTLGAERCELTAAAIAREPAFPDGLLPGHYVQLWVADTGTGMDPTTLARAIEPFFTTKSQGQGTGLGLSMAHGFATQSGGALRIDSAQGQGTTVRIWLPCPPAASPAAAPQAPAAPLGHVLVVEDQAMMRRFLRECLELAGWEVTLAADAGQALLHLDAGRPCDLLMTDLTMPGMDGAALIRSARAHRPGLPCLLLTGTGQLADLARQAEREGFALLPKPVSPLDLSETVAGLASPGRARRAFEGGPVG